MSSNQRNFLALLMSLTFVCSVGQLKAQDLVIPSSAAGESANDVCCGPGFTIDGSALEGEGLEAVHSAVNARDYVQKFWISRAFEDHPVRLTYSFDPPATLSGMAIWATTFVPPDVGDHHIGDGAISEVDFEVTHDDGVTVYPGYVLDTQLATGQSLAFGQIVVGVVQVDIITVADVRPDYPNLND